MIINPLKVKKAIFAECGDTKNSAILALFLIVAYFKDSNGIRQIVKMVPLTNFLTETDGPVTYRSNPYNGQMTKPSFIKTIIENVAEIKKMDIRDIANQIAINFEDFFNIKLS